MTVTNPPYLCALYSLDPALIRDATRAMFGLKAEALKLMQLSEDGETTAGPTFQYVDPGDRG